MKILRHEIAVRRATRHLLQQTSPDSGRIAKLTAEIFELQRSILTKYQVRGMITAT